MGTAHVEIGQIAIDIIKEHNLLKILEVRDFDEGSFLVLVESDVLADGYHGQCEVFFRTDDLGQKSVHFRKERDT